ncbi:CRISPR-associated protein Csm3 [Eubacterium ruminantium]|nr:CRISPR-associated protein Csm3 [Eubacterium ruminantium]
MFAKIEITGVIEVVTGMHIGGSSAFAAIGAVDSPVIRDAATNLPMIPGSSLKGKMRTLLSKQYNTEIAAKPDDDDEKLTRIFGSAKKGNVKRSRLLVSDMVLVNADELRRQGIQSITEVKFENSINRLTAVANPRQIERAVRGSKFNLDMIYEIDNSSNDPENELVEDFSIIAEGLKLLEYDYLGGSGSRGYGKVKFNDLNADVVIGEVDEAVLKKCNDVLKSK